MTVTHFLFLCNNNLLQYVAMQSDVFVLANMLPENIYYFCVTINCNSLIKLIVLSFLHVYFSSQLWSKPSVSCACIFLFSTTNYQIIYIVSELQYNINSWSIFIVMSVVPVYFCSQLLSKPSDSCACIFLFLQTVCQLRL